MQIKNAGKFAAATLLLCGAGAANLAAAADKTSLLTLDDTMIGVSMSQYDYREPNMIIPTGTSTMAYSDVKSSGTSYGIHGEKTWGMGDGDFLRLDANFQGGKMDYHGSGFVPNETTRFLDMRLVYGVDSELGAGILATYAGLGYRYLYNDARASAKVGNTVYYGYEREQQYTYLPVGVQYKTLWKNKRVTWSGEAGLLISGSNRSHSATMNYNFKQRTGFEARLGASLNQGAWEIGPYVNYWRINDSEPIYETVAGKKSSYIEPRNTTVDVGVKIDRHF